MGQITSGIGLISGINTAELIDQLLAIEARPKALVQNRVAVLQAQQVAFQDINAKLLSLKLSANALATNSSFKATSATSSNEDVLTATSGTTAVPGTYDFAVDRLVSGQQLITRGFADTDLSPIAVGGGALTFEFGAARLDSDTDVSLLNGGLGISRGRIRITDRAGASATVDLSKALTVSDVLDAINLADGIGVTASIDGDQFVLTDNTGSTATNLSVADVGFASTARSLGLDAAAVGDTLTGSQVNLLGASTPLAFLNDGNGIHHLSVQDDFSIAYSGGSFNVNLSQVNDLDDVFTAIATASSGAVTAGVNATGTGLVLTDTIGAGPITVTGLNGSGAAADLGIEGTSGGAQLDGARILSTLNSRLVHNLKGGAGAALGTISITDRSGASDTVDLSGARTVDQVLSLINGAAVNVTAALNDSGNGIILSDGTGLTAANLTVADVSGTGAADLNLAASVDAASIDSGNLQFRYIAESTRLAQLNGGRGVSRGQFIITDSSGASATVDLTQGNEITIQDVLAEINSRGLSLNARINDSGDGILIEDTGPGVLAVKVEESGSTTARDLGIRGEASSPGQDLVGSFEKTLNVASVEVLLGTTALSTLNGGDGVQVAAGQDDLSLATRDGSAFSVNLDGVATVDDVINAIAAATGGAVTAAINSVGTALQLTDNTAGSNTFAVAALNASEAAADLGILGADDNGDGIISGSSVVEVFTLQDLVDTINDDPDLGVTATIINDGSFANPYRLSISSTEAGGAGAFVFDDGGLGLGAQVLSEARNAVVFFGSADPAQAIVITSPTNSLKDVVPGTTIDLRAPSNGTVQVSIARDDASIVDSVSTFVKNFNSVIETLDRYDAFDAETEQRGLLLGDATVSSIRASMFRLVNSRSSDLSGQFTTLSQVGIRVGSGARLSFDADKFRSALQADSEALEALFTFKESQTDELTGESTITKAGVGVRIDQLLANLTDSVDGSIQSRVDALDSQIQISNRRIDQFDVLLEAKRLRLQTQFDQMERALAQLQQQSSALLGLQNLVANTVSNG